MQILTALLCLRKKQISRGDLYEKDRMLGNDFGRRARQPSQSFDEKHREAGGFIWRKVPDPRGEYRMVDRTAQEKNRNGGMIHGIDRTEEKQSIRCVPV